MKLFRYGGALVIALLALAQPALAQTPPRIIDAGKVKRAITTTAPSGVSGQKGTMDEVYCANCDGSGGGTTGGATEEKQDALIARLETSITRFDTLIAQMGLLSSPAVNSTNYLLRNGIVVNTHAVTQSGAWTVALSGTLPAFAATPTVNLGTIGLIATTTKQDTIITTLNQLVTEAQSPNAVLTKPVATTANARTSVAASATAVLLLSPNTARTGCVVNNESTAGLRIGLVSAPSLTSYDYPVPAMTTDAGFFECPYGYTGAVYGIWTSATGNARVGERTPS